jgi:hypothetical protein
LGGGDADDREGTYDKGEVSEDEAEVEFINV